VAAGDRVAQGALLVELDPRKYQARLSAAESRRQEKRLLHEEAQRELARSLELYERTMLSEHDRQLAQIEAAKAEAALREAQAGLTEAKLRREYSRIKAPFEGRVIAVHVQAGETVVNRQQASPLVTLVDQRRMLARTRIDEKTMVRLRPGDKVQIGVRGVWLEGEIAAIGFDPVSLTADGAAYRMDAGFTPDERMELRSGEKLVIRLPDE
jgi:multidrug efflux system membrane fusion protein